MNSICETIRNVIDEHILPRIERDGIGGLILPEQIKSPSRGKSGQPAPLCNLRHPEHELAIGLAGKAPYCIAGKTVIFTPYKMAFMPSMTIHGPGHVRLWDTSTLELDKSSAGLVLWLTVYPFGVRVQVSRFVGKTDAIGGTRPYMLLDRQVSRLMSCLADEVGAKPANYARVGRCILMEFMERCLRADTAASSVNVLTAHSTDRSTSLTTGPKHITGRVQAAQEFIRSNYHTSIGLDEIAAAVDASGNHLRRQFKAATGLTPMQYLLAFRMEAARELLLTDLKVAEIAELVGIDDPSYFGQVFRRNNDGLTPLRYRRKMSGEARRYFTPEETTSS